MQTIFVDYTDSSIAFKENVTPDGPVSGDFSYTITEPVIELLFTHTLLDTNTLSVDIFDFVPGTGCDYTVPNSDLQLM